MPVFNLTVCLGLVFVKKIIKKNSLQEDSLLDLASVTDSDVFKLQT